MLSPLKIIVYSKEPDKICYFLLKFFALLCLKFENCLCLILKYLVYHFRTCFSILISRDLFEAILGTHSCKNMGFPSGSGVKNQPVSAGDWV